MHFRVCAAALAILLPASAAHSGGTLMVSAVVPKTAQLAVRGQPATFVVTESDIARGYVDIAAGPSLEVKTNSPDGLQVGFFASDEIVRAVQPAWLVLSGAPRGSATHRIGLDYRLLLSPSARPGVYAWPVQVIATPL